MDNRVHKFLCVKGFYMKTDDKAFTKGKVYKTTKLNNEYLIFGADNVGNHNY